MEKVIALNKKIGETPLDVIKRVRKKCKNLSGVKMAYSGRLDPMAEGLMLILVGDECKNRKSYERLPKEYEFEVLFGIATDSYDVLGLITNVKHPSFTNTKQEILNCLPSFTGKFEQAYPPYSSPKVNGKPLFEWAKRGKIGEIEIPNKKIEVFTIKLKSMRKISKEELLKTVIFKINQVKGDFRQEKIKESWNTTIINSKIQEFPVAKFSISCTSGTYVRSIADEAGKKLYCAALAFSIKRTKVGTYSL